MTDHETNRPDLRAVIREVRAPLDAAGVQRTEKQLAALPLKDRAAFVREQILALNHLVEEARRRGAPYAVNVGRALLVTKAELKHGEFQAWIEKECKLGLSTGRLYMQLARRAAEMKAKGLDLNATSVRAMRTMVSQARQGAKLEGRPIGSKSDPRATHNEIRRCIVLLNHLCNNGDPDVMEKELLPELARVLSELKKRKT
jgi:hypothetical protein